MSDYITLGDCNNPARGQKQGISEHKNEQETEKKRIEKNTGKDEKRKHGLL